MANGMCWTLEVSKGGVWESRLNIFYECLCSCSPLIVFEDSMKASRHNIMIKLVNHYERIASLPKWN